MRYIFRFFMFCASIGFLGAIAAIFVIIGVVYKYGQALPDFSQLKDYKPPVITRVHAADGRFLAEFAQEKRIFVPIYEMPDLVRHAFISAEDQNFYKHTGVDIMAIGRAVVTNFKNRAAGKRPVGASTITQQVAKNFLLGNELSYERKIREAILAYRMEQILSKDKLLELYLNEIFLGARSYGVAAAALNYFNKPLTDLTVEEAAYLAALPKAPNNYNPTTRQKAAIERRNWVIGRMLEDGYITKQQAEAATASELKTIARADGDIVSAPYFAEEVRRELVNEFGNEGLYRGGLSVRTTLDPQLQIIAAGSLQKGLENFDRRKGYRGSVAHIDNITDWQNTLEKMAPPEGMLPHWLLAAVLSAKAERIDIGVSDGTRTNLSADDLAFAGGKLRTGDIIMVEAEKALNKDGKEAGEATYRLRQVPKVSGALVALNPHTGAVLAMQGGWVSNGNGFNRATQAKRQPGSAFKPFIYLAALDKGYTPSSIIVDGPISFTDTAGNVWNPENYSGEFYGPTPLRVGVEKSRNLMTIRLAQNIGIKTVVDYAKKFGISDNMQPHLANALGSTETTLMDLTAAYGMIVNGGKQISPVFYDRVQDRYGKTLKRADTRSCNGCGPLIKWEGQYVPEVADNRVQIADPRTTYQMVSILEGVVERGTATKLKELERPIAGKTGTTNNSKDAWFIGFTPDLVVGVFVGYDEPKSLGEKETGGSVAVPIFKDFMQQALKDVPPTPFRIPPGVRMVQVNAASGRPTSSDDANAIWEPFLAGTEPNNTIIDLPTNEDGVAEIEETLPAPEMLQQNPESSPSLSGTGGLY